MKTKRKIIVMITGSLLLLSGCRLTPTAAVTEEQNAGLPNPASVFCEDQGGTLEIRTEADGGQYGVCIFDDGSECDEWAYFRGECQPGDSLETQPADEDSGPASEADDIVVARQAIVEYLIQHYAIEIPGEWQDFEGGPNDSPTTRFVSDSWMIALTPVENAAEPPIYEVEIGNVTGFNWQGTIDANGEIQEKSYIPPATVLSADEARDAVVAFLIETYNLTAPGVWAVERPESEEPGMEFVLFTSEAWTVEVRFMPAAPIVSKYNLVIDNTSVSLHWEGEITSQGKISEIQVTQE